MSRKTRQQKKLIGYQEQSNIRQTEHAGELNYKYGEMAAEEAARRQKEFYDYQRSQETYAEEVRQIEEAGLSYGIIGGGLASSGGGGVPMGGGAGGQKGKGADAAAARMAAIEEDLARTQQAQAVAETGLLGAETQKAIAETKNINQQTNVSETLLEGQVGIQNVTIDKITSDINSSKIQDEGQELQNEFDKIRNAIQKETKEYQINKQITELNVIKEDLRAAIDRNEISEATKEEVIGSIKQQYYKLIAETIESSSNTKLNEEQRNKVVFDIANAGEQNRLTLDAIYEITRKNDITEREGEKNRKNEIYKSLINGVSTIIGSYK